MTREEWQMQMLILTHEESDAERYNAALHTLEAWDIAQRMKAEQQAKEIARLREALSELHAQVQGECPSLLNDDSGGDAKLALEIEALLKEEHP